MNKARKAQHIRILQNDHKKDLNDYQEIQYLRDKGLANAEVRISYTQENYGKPIDAIWIGPTAAGLDYLDELLQEQISQEEYVNQLPSEHSESQLPNGEFNPVSQKSPKSPNTLKRAFSQARKSTKFLLITVIVAVIGAISSETIALLLARHVEFFQ